MTFIVTLMQRRILDYLCKDPTLLNTQIATRIRKSQGAVEQHLVKMYRLTGVNDRLALINLSSQIVGVDMRGGNRKKAPDESPVSTPQA